MTSEIAILNKQGVAIAADSAVTVGAREKVFTSADKIFPLENGHPVAIMVFGSAEFMGIPWETIIKTYSKQLGQTSFNKLEDYKTDFFKFLTKSNKIFPENIQKICFISSVAGYYSHILNQLRNKIYERIESNKEITDSEIKSLLDSEITSHIDKFEKMPKENSLSKKVRLKWGKDITKIRDKKFERHSLTEKNKKQLLKIAYYLASSTPSDVSNQLESGLVIVGFGNDDYFAKAIAPYVEHMIFGYVKCNRIKTAAISIENDASIRPFAQTDMVRNFMEGMDPEYQSKINEDIKQIFKEYPEELLESIPNIAKTNKTELMKKLSKIGENEANRYSKHLKDFRNIHYVKPVLKIVATLPKPELAFMAESLVALTSLKRKVTDGAETVAGPIDVAIISKGDGFCWVKKKQLDGSKKLG